MYGEDMQDLEKKMAGSSKLILYPMNICFVASEFILLQKNSGTMFTKEFFPINVFQWYTTMFWLVMFNIDIFSRKCLITFRTLNWLNIINHTISITFADMPLKIWLNNRKRQLNCTNLNTVQWTASQKVWEEHKAILFSTRIRSRISGLDSDGAGPPE